MRCIAPGFPSQTAVNHSKLISYATGWEIEHSMSKLGDAKVPEVKMGVEAFAWHVMPAPFGTVRTMNPKVDLKGGTLKDSREAPLVSLGGQP
jgi:hypothetical protein